MSERLALPPAEAAAMLSMSRDSFDRHVRDELRLVRVGRKVLIPVKELERWLELNAARTLGEG
jgi:excisionase family DNA binding protein